MTSLPLITEPAFYALAIPAVLLLGIAMGTRLFPPQADSPPPPRWAGFILTATSGFISFVAHVGEPPINADVIPMRLFYRLVYAGMFLTGVKLLWDAW